MTIAETERLLIRSWRESDAQHVLTMSGDSGYNCFSTPGYFLVKDVEEARGKLVPRITAFNQRGTGKFPVLLKETGEFIGTCGIDPYDLEGRPEHELGYRFCLQHWGKGYATETGTALMRYGFERLKLKRLLAFAVPQNPGSLRVIEKLGFHYVGMMKHAGIPHKLYEQVAKQHEKMA